MSDESGYGRGLGDAGARARALTSSSAASVFEAMPVGVALLDGAGRVVHANAVLADLVGAGAAGLGGRTLDQLVVATERDTVADRLDALLAGRTNSFECRLAATPASLGGRTWTVRAHVAPTYGSDGTVAGLVLQVFDLGPAGGPPPLPVGLAAVLEEGSDFLITADADGRLTYGNRAAREVLGVLAADGAAHLDELLEPSSLELYRDLVVGRVTAEGSWQGELTLRARAARAVPVSARVVGHRAPGSAADAPPVGVSVFARDITELKSAERKLRQLATHDYLTGLPNRLLLYDRLELALNRFARYGTPVALMFCDLDGFKPVNDAYGHQVGDAVLTEVADRIHSVVRDTDTAARLGGDEFAVLVEGVDDLDQLTNVAERLVAAIAEPVRVNGATARVGVSVGIVVASEGCSEPDDLVAAADAAMYRAKEEGRGRFHLWSEEGAAGGERH
jgi:diguanylate cyclase (GGDEF)-like protein/PAS domain S-box-containing protein